VAIQASEAGIPLYCRQTYWEDDTGALSWLDVLAGKYDAQIDYAVDQIVNAGLWSTSKPYVLVNGAEMDVNTPSQPLNPDNTSAVYPQMFAYCARRIEAKGARITQGGPIAISWSPRAEQWLWDASNPWSAYAFAPDPADYDYVGAHAYLKWDGRIVHGTQLTWQSRDLSELVQRLHDFSAPVNRHIMVFEGGIAAPDPDLASDQDRADLITGFFRSMAQWKTGPGQFRLMSWTNRTAGGGGNYQIRDMGPASLAALKAAVNTRFYQAAGYGRITSRPA
jgi:hypothetical protein